MPEENCIPEGSEIVDANEVLIYVPFCGADGKSQFYLLEAQTDGSIAKSFAQADAQTKNTKFDNFVMTRKSATVSVGYNLIPDDEAPAQQAFEDYTDQGREFGIQIRRPGKRTFYGKGHITDQTEPTSTDAGPVAVTATMRLKGAWGYNSAYAGI